MASNGYLPMSDLAKAGNGYYLRKDAARAWHAFQYEVHWREGDTVSLNAGYRTYSRQVYWRNWWCNQGKCGNAAIPGTSNHGWGLAIDLMTPWGRAMVDKYGAKYGFSKAWSDASHEWWHIKWRPGVWDGKYRKQPNPFAALTKVEEKVVREYLKLKKSGKNPERRKELWRWMRDQKKRIRKEAKKSKNGWKIAHRKERWRILHTYTGIA